MRSVFNCAGIGMNPRHNLVFSLAQPVGGRECQGPDFTLATPHRLAQWQHGRFPGISGGGSQISATVNPRDCQSGAPAMADSQTAVATRT